MNNSLNLKKETGNPKLDAHLEKLAQYDFSLITNSCIEKYGWDEKFAKDTEIEVKRFFSLAFLDSGFYHIPTPNVDEYWHRMILHTLWYVEFCDSIFGEYYHHTPTADPTLMNEEDRKRSLKLIEYWFGYSWDKLILTCTQCKGPYKSPKFVDLKPLYKYGD